MFPFVVAIFILLPLAELWVLLRAGAAWGAGTTIFVIIITGFLGASLARAQGLRVLFQIQEDLRRGLMPAERIVDGCLILLAGLVLLTPGFITDAAGFFVLWPAGRAWLKRIVTEQCRKRTNGGVNVDYVIEDE